MNDHRFIELVNLYVDREITAAETGELETEIQTNPKRRAIYNQYCKMNRATALVYDSFRAQAAEPSTPLVGQGTIAKFENAKRDRRPSWTVYAGGLAAAACVAFALVRFNAADAASSQVQAPVVAQIQAQQSAQPIAVAVVTAGPTPATAGLVSLRNSAENERNYAALLTALRQDDERSVADAQIKAMRTHSLFEDGVFDTKQLPAGVNQRMFGNQQSNAPQAEFTAFQFQR